LQEDTGSEPELLASISLALSVSLRVGEVGSKNSQSGSLQQIVRLLGRRQYFFGAFRILDQMTLESLTGKLRAGWPAWALCRPCADPALRFGPFCPPPALLHFNTVHCAVWSNLSLLVQYSTVHNSYCTLPFVFFR